MFRPITKVLFTIQAKSKLDLLHSLLTKSTSPRCLARYVIPHPVTRINDYEGAILVAATVVWFSISPWVIVSFYWWAINPVEPRVGYISPEADPCPRFFRPPKEVANKSVFLGWVDNWEVCAHTVAFFPGSLHCGECGTHSVITRDITSSPACRTTWKKTNKQTK